MHLLFFQQNPKQFMGGGLASPPLCRVIYTDLGQSVIKQMFFVLSILHYKYLRMECSKSNCASDGILFVMISIII